MTEIWKNITGYEGLYQVSNLGRVRSLRKNIIMSFSDSNVYSHINLSKHGKRRTFLAHRLVALAFIPNPDNKPCIDHIDGNPTNNHVSNLRWCTMMENQNFPLAIKNKIGINSKDSNYRYKIDRNDNPFCKPIIQLDLNFKFVKEYRSMADASEALNIKAYNISKVCSGVKNKTKGFIFMHKKDYDGIKNNR